jgi:hypothetical protein
MDWKRVHKKVGQKEGRAQERAEAVLELLEEYDAG